MLEQFSINCCKTKVNNIFKQSQRTIFSTITERKHMLWRGAIWVFLMKHDIYIYIYIQPFSKRLTFWEYILINIYLLLSFVYFDSFDRNSKDMYILYIFSERRPFWKRVEIYLHIHIYFFIVTCIFNSNFNSWNGQTLKKFITSTKKFTMIGDLSRVKKHNTET